MDKKELERIADTLEDISKSLDGVYELLYILTNKLMEKS